MYGSAKFRHIVMFGWTSCSLRCVAADIVLTWVRIASASTYVVAQDITEGAVVTGLGDWRLSIFGTRRFLLRMPDRFQTQALRTLVDFVFAQARDWSK